MAFLKDKLPSSRLVTIDDATHLLNMEHAVEFDDIVSSFLAEL